MVICVTKTISLSIVYLLRLAHGYFWHTHDLKFNILWFVFLCLSLEWLSYFGEMIKLLFYNSSIYNKVCFFPFVSLIYVEFGLCILWGRDHIFFIWLAHTVSTYPVVLLWLMLYIKFLNIHPSWAALPNGGANSYSSYVHLINHKQSQKKIFSQSH